MENFKNRQALLNIIFSIASGIGIGLYTVAGLMKIVEFEAIVTLGFALFYRYIVLHHANHISTHLHLLFTGSTLTLVLLCSLFFYRTTIIIVLTIITAVLVLMEWKLSLFSKRIKSDDLGNL